ncbi:hypothetical protein [Falsibacillus pallidus]|uniref:DUF3953 domain-containing protein n=1 Tax=Falsibacillus pallidus TaxID=493781 RepID=A0A370G1X0_9BACI|nr:hypothetical protein [Falsibacillus pallidus]RDI37230.1 hypothetical protein DFR59_12220 [Falsibacillus pallidus]
MKPGTIICIIIVLLGIAHQFYKTLIIPIAVAILFIILLAMVLVKAIKTKDKFRTYGSALFIVALVIFVIRWFAAL